MGAVPGLPPAQALAFHRGLLLLPILLLFLPYETLRGAFGHAPHFRKTVAGSTLASSLFSFGAPLPAPPPPPRSTLFNLPSGGGGDGPDVEYWGECQAALNCSACGVARDPSLPMRLPAAYAPLRSVVDKADFTRSAVMMAWAEAVASVPELATPRPHFTFLETSHDVELHALPWYATISHRDECMFDGTTKCDLHVLRAERPLSETERGDATATTGHPVLRRAPYDLQMYSQTLEHLYDPPLAVARMFNLAAPGGLVWASMPAWNILHMVPSHQQGLTPCGMFALFRGAGFEVVRLGWYGTVGYSAFVARPGSHWPTWKELGEPDPFSSIPPSERSGRANTVWLLARRPHQGNLPLPRPQPSEVELSTRPLLIERDMFYAASIKTKRTPHSSTLAGLLGRFPHWAGQDLAALVLAGEVEERLLPRLVALGFNFKDDAEVEASSLRYGTPPLLVYGRTARAIVGALLPENTARLWVPSGLAVEDSVPAVSGKAKAEPRALSRAAFLTDLFESTRDPLYVLRAALDAIVPGAPLLLACRPADVVSARHHATLGVCTELGFQQLLFRAGLLTRDFVASYGAWGRVDYTARALTWGAHLSVADYAAGDGKAPMLLREALSAGSLVPAEQLNALDTLLSALLDGEDSTYGWTAVVWALIENPA